MIQANPSLHSPLLGKRNAKTDKHLLNRLAKYHLYNFEKWPFERFNKIHLLIFDLCHDCHPKEPKIKIYKAFTKLAPPQSKVNDRQTDNGWTDNSALEQWSPFLGEIPGNVPTKSTKSSSSFWDPCWNRQQMKHDANCSVDHWPSEKKVTKYSKRQFYDKNNKPSYFNESKNSLRFTFILGIKKYM